MEKDFAFELYKLYRSEIYESSRLHRDTLQNYLAFNTAVLGATIAGIFKALEMANIGWLGLVVLVGPFLNIAICALAVKMCDRFYRGVCERIVLVLKLEYTLGLRDLESAPYTENEAPPHFPKDKYFFPKRWTKSKGDTSETFIREQMRSSVNLVAKRTFYLIIAVNIVLAIGIVVFTFCS